MKGMSRDRNLDDVQILGIWNFTLQADTPVYWIKSGSLDRYLLSFKVRSPIPSTCGLVMHAEADGTGTDGASFWIERRGGQGDKEALRRYVLAGDGLESKPVVTRSYPDPGSEFTEDVEVLMQGYSGAILLQNRQVQIRFRTKKGSGSIGFYNATKGDTDDVSFAGVRITALRRGPMEVAGVLGRRERAMLRAPMNDEERDAADSEYGVGSSEAPESPAPVLTGYSSISSDTYASPSQQRTGPNGNWRRQGPGLRPSASDGVLRKSAGRLFTPDMSLTGSTSGKRSTGGRMVPFMKNAPAGEM